MQICGVRIMKNAAELLDFANVVNVSENLMICFRHQNENAIYLSRSCVFIAVLRNMPIFCVSFFPLVNSLSSKNCMAELSLSHSSVF